MLLGLLVVACAGASFVACSEAPATPRTVVASAGFTTTSLPVPARPQSPRRPAVHRAPLSAAAQQVFVEALTASDWMTRLAATQALGLLPGPQPLLWLEQRLADVEPDVRAAAVTQLALRCESRARALLLSVQDDESEELAIRVAAASGATHPRNPCQ